MCFRGHVHLFFFNNFTTKFAIRPSFLDLSSIINKIWILDNNLREQILSRILLTLLKQILGDYYVT